MGKLHKTMIGGQALIEGVMMRGPEKTSMAVRLPDGKVDIETWDNISKSKKVKKIPIVRGVVNFVESMIIGYKTLMKSAEKAGVEDEEPSKFDKWLTDKLGDKIFKVIAAIASVISVVFAIALFVLLPSFLAKVLSKYISSGWLALIEGIIKIAIFIGYMFITSLLKDIRRVYQYHGAEHKTIACYEAGDELIPENIKKYKRFHPRCGTSFIFIVLILSILIFSLPFITWDNIFLRAITKIALVPLLVGISYEFIKLAGRYDNVVTRCLSAPGLWLQRITTKEPDESMMEIAAAAMLEVIPENKEDDKW
ncbi:MAG: DUF1385 domain-containing protein [Oscillospiraceae bacterium]|nr:DUF1385 domain-containing protein [Oscillospiraceae bacterium]